MKKGQPEAFLDEGFNGRAALVGSMAFSIFVTEKGEGAVKKITLYVVLPSTRSVGCMHCDLQQACSLAKVKVSCCRHCVQV